MIQLMDGINYTLDAAGLSTHPRNTLHTTAIEAPPKLPCKNLPANHANPLPQPVLQKYHTVNKMPYQKILEYN
jgi:hypothetical protein